ncbi:hypothetical protein AVEN_183045-1 [Araneus ventricosus]|uniref:Uncharacterized protein n=1 Tax=Araneus ventricosus TaxID=182803 RepID=A0A4Y2EZW0_ARAVE|nr:hypothetical protein AVEN_183045-1 [Araneus ventricosus]
MIRTDKIKCWTLTFQNSISTCIMDDSNKSKIFTFGKLENPEDSDSEESLSDSTDEESVSKYRGKDISSKTNENHQDLVKETERLNFKDFRHEVPIKSSDASSTASYDFCTRRNYDERSLTRDDELMLPSEVTDKEYVYMPPTSEEIDDEEDMNTSGKWMVFPKGDLQKLDQYWLALIPLYKNGTLTRLKCSTAMGSDPGVINCYTADSEILADVKNAGDAIRECIDYDTIMYYKTNVATALGLYMRFGSKNISKYMHTVKNCLYKKVKFERWKLVSL